MYRVTFYDDAGGRHSATVYAPNPMLAATVVTASLGARPRFGTIRKVR